MEIPHFQFVMDLAIKNKGNIKILRYVKTYLWEFFGFLVVLACPPFLKVAELEDFDLQLNAELFDRHGVNKFLHLQGNHFESPNQQMENLR